MDFPHFLRQAGKQNIDIMLVPAYDWKEITPLHAEMASFVAIANGFSLIRPNGKGLSAVFDFRGNEIASLNTFSTNEKILLAEVPVKSPTTIYFLIGNVIVLLSFLFLIFALVLRILKK